MRENKSLSGLEWEEQSYNIAQAKKIMQQYQTSDLLSKILDQNGIGFDDIPVFLDPKIKTTIPDPFHFLDMRKAVEFTAGIIKDKKKICIYGDYDVDGATSSALLKAYFRYLSLDSMIYIPDRFKEGYGPNIEAFKKLKDDNVDLVITVDCGTTSLQEMEYAKSINLDVIILDHHLCSEIPDTIAVVNPNRIDETTLYKHLAAVGVSFMFVCALNSYLEQDGYFGENTKPNLLNLLDLVALGTICDVMKLDNLNRAFVKQGLRVIAQRSNKGFKILADVSGASNNISTYDLGFIIGPRINAGGRVGQSHIGSTLLSCLDDIEANKLALELNQYNNERKEIEAIVLEEAIDQVDLSPIDVMNYVYSDDWHQGVIGIVASRLKDRDNKPSFVLSIDGDYAKCSARSIKGIDLGNLIIKAKGKNLIEQGGGHSMAGGFRVHKDKIEDVKSLFIQEISKMAKRLDKVNIRQYNLNLPLSAINMDLYSEIHKLEPFGPGNNEPITRIYDVKIVKKDLRAQKHILCLLTDRDGSRGAVSAIAYNAHQTPMFDYLMEEYNQNDDISIIGVIKKNDWNGREKLQVIIKDICVSP